MRVGRKIWGPGPTPTSRVVLAYPSDELTDAQLAAYEKIEVTDDDAAKKAAKPEPKSKPAAKKATKKGDD